MKVISLPGVRRAFGAFAALLAVPVVLAGCGGGGGGSNPPPQQGWRSVNPLPTQAKKKWTFLVFLNAANDLESFSQLNINQMEQVGSDGNVNIVVQVKRGGNRWDPDFTQWTDTATRRFYVTRDTNTTTINSQLMEINDGADMGKASTLKEFVQWAIPRFPADRYAIVLWNHGAGWRARKPSSYMGRGVSYDDLTRSHIDTIELPNALDIGRKWDVVAFDSSLMQMLEVAHEIRNQALYITGSEESPPDLGYTYDVFLSKLKATPTMDGRALATRIAQDTFETYPVRFPDRSSELTQSVLDASKVGAITSAVHTMGQELLRVKPQYGTAIANARSLTENFYYPENRDLIDFCDLLLETPAGGTTPRVPDAAARTAISAARQATLSALVYEDAARQHPRAKGLAIFLPSPTDYLEIDTIQANGFGQRYGQLAFTQAAPGWQQFLIQGPP